VTSAFGLGGRVEPTFSTDGKIGTGLATTHCCHVRLELYVNSSDAVIFSFSPALPSNFLLAVWRGKLAIKAHLH